MRRACSGCARCYVWERGEGNQNFFEARGRCVARGGDLVSFETAAEQAAFDALHFVDDAWVGLEDFEQDLTYDWLGGPVFAGVWAPSQPDNTENKPRCGYLAWDGALANHALDTACDDDFTEYVCELRGDNP